ncbi:MAG: bifunctional (p)ppGpp synthetase/guanosine-3',5'-bis(diphosphate) 3'-pyrophosphohydrolase [Tenericutes bacterium]|nr:bifunctional (p)ppGpp synthetase/guanosine-3',5'-bis(diphosphate) 3'-pyrophosphohydrolase [Mycoplasmatota bacterium]
MLESYMDSEYIKFINRYYEQAKIVYEGMKRETGEDYIFHPISVAYILADLKMDPVTIGCALIHEAISLGKMTYEEIENMFGTESAIIVNSISKISNLKQTFKINNPEKYRRIIVGLSESPATLFIKFADRLHNLRTLKVHDKEHQKYIIDETQNIYIPIAHRLGMKKVKSEMEDLCLQNVASSEYNKILERINLSKDELESALIKMKDEIVQILEAHNIKFEILYRVKSVRGIYNKISIGKKWEDIYDLLGLRVLVDTVEDCYRVIGLIQSKYPPIPNRFKDYISNPKPNLYQSLHTTVFGEGKRIYEVQIRTYDMDEIAEKGVASHWSYKEKIDGSVKKNLDMMLEQFRVLVEVNDIEQNMEFFGNIKESLKRNEIYVYTPKGDIIELPAGATPIDFAYKIHSEVGNTTTGALVNSKMVKLDHSLCDGDMVELITQKGHAPSKGWLKIVKTEAAKSRIKSYFYKKEREKYISLGKEMMLNECKKRNLDINEVFNDENVKKVCTSLNLETLEDIYFSVSTLRYLPSSILNRIEVQEVKKKLPTLERKSDKSTNAIIIANSTDILYTLASCCNPVYGEDIVGYITKGYGVKIHSKDCPNIDKNSERLIEASWEENPGSRYTTKLKVYVDDIGDILLKIITLSTKMDIIIDSINLINRNKELFYDISCKVKNIDSLNNFIDEVKTMNSVKEVERIFI